MSSVPPSAKPILSAATHTDEYRPAFPSPPMSETIEKPISEKPEFDRPSSTAKKYDRPIHIVPVMPQVIIVTAYSSDATT